ncbi:CLAVATA3/ESR (CLE)-related protein 41 [Heracleum sosnowskyi]|uniref:CLAVATA3/ESR (CLE)-related protein 41 n=1 Tax=Heracleum sosnowskyi TaxID=360622 RepID=A0AAD8MBJ7_9APIA|nr:CLAVATA3/ESR (CLE)-related protein 41 [Heracleum sosnowskyi]
MHIYSHVDQVFYEVCNPYAYGMAKENALTLNNIMTNFSFKSCYILASTTLLFFLLIIVSTTDQNLPPLPEISVPDKTMKSSVPKSTSQSFRQEDTAQPTVSTGRRGGPYRSVNWRERSVNASAHEVPSGPNPISNR